MSSPIPPSSATSATSSAATAARSGVSAASTVVTVPIDFVDTALLTSHGLLFTGFGGLTTAVKPEDSPWVTGATQTYAEFVKDLAHELRKKLPASSRTDPRIPWGWARATRPK